MSEFQDSSIADVETGPLLATLPHRKDSTRSTGRRQWFEELFAKSRVTKPCRSTEFRTKGTGSRSCCNLSSHASQLPGSGSARSFSPDSCQLPLTVTTPELGCSSEQVCGQEVLCTSFHRQFAFKYHLFPETSTTMSTTRELQK